MHTSTRLVPRPGRHPHRHRPRCTWLLQEIIGIEAWIDPAGVVLLVALGLAMGFGMLVILRGARDL